MKIVYVMAGEQRFYGIFDSDAGIVRRIHGSPFFESNEIVETNERWAFSELKLLAPVPATKIVAVGKNYHEHALEMKEGEPTEPLLFLKPSTSILEPNGAIVYPAISQRVDYEGELGVVIGKRCRNVSEEDADAFIFGYTCLNDVTARDIQKSDPQWTRGKSFDTFCPIGPWVETEIKNPQNLKIITRLNGNIVQNSNTSCMTHGIKRLISYASRVMTLLPGDIIATGTPEGIGPMRVGDRVEVEIENIGTLRNYIVEEAL